MQQQTTKRKKKEKPKPKGLSLSYEGIDETNKIKTLAQLQERIRITLKYHIGRENALSTYDFFISVIGVSPHELDTFKRSFWWNIIKKLCSEMRKEGVLFPIIEGCNVYILKTETEAERFNKRLESDINGLRKAQIRASEWVRGEKWRNL